MDGMTINHMVSIDHGSHDSVVLEDPEPNESGDPCGTAS